MNRYLPEGSYIIRPDNREYTSSLSGLEHACQQGKILEGIAVMCDGNMELTVELGEVKGIIPRDEICYSPNGAEIKDIAVITRVGKPVCFKVIGFGKDENGRTVAFLSRRAAQAECAEIFLSELISGDIIDARVTHLEQFGAFVDIGCGIVSLLSVDCISVSRISHPRERFRVGMQIKTVIKSVDRENFRIYVTHKELLGNWKENAMRFSVGQTVSGIVRSIESYGVFVELAPNLAGLAERKEGICAGQCAAVYIKNIIPERMKVKLVIIDPYSENINPSVLQYFVPEHISHIDSWNYSPPECEKRIFTEFS